MQILDTATVAGLIGADWPVSLIEAGQWFDTTDDTLAWAARVYPEAGELRHHVFAALVHTHVTSWSEPWSLDSHPLYQAGERLIRHARGGSQQEARHDAQTSPSPALPRRRDRHAAVRAGVPTAIYAPR